MTMRQRCWSNRQRHSTSAWRPWNRYTLQRWCNLNVNIFLPHRTECNMRYYLLFSGSIRKRLTHWTRLHGIVLVLVWSWESNRKTVRSENFSKKTKVRGALLVGCLGHLHPYNIKRSVMKDDSNLTESKFLHAVVLVVCIFVFCCTSEPCLFSLQSYGHHWKSISRR